MYESISLVRAQHLWATETLWETKQKEYHFGKKWLFCYEYVKEKLKKRGLGLQTDWKRQS